MSRLVLMYRVGMRVLRERFNGGVGRQDAVFSRGKSEKGWGFVDENSKWRELDRIPVTLSPCSSYNSSAVSSDPRILVLKYYGNCSKAREVDRVVGGRNCGSVRCWHVRCVESQLWEFVKR